MSPSPYHDAFDEVMDIQKCDFSKHPTAGMSLIEQNGRLILAHMTPSTPGTKVPRWCTWLHGAWLIKIDGKSVTTIEDARKVFESLSNNGATSAHLLFAHPEVHPDISRRGLPIISSEPLSLLTHAQLNDCWEFSTDEKLTIPIKHQGFLDMYNGIDVYQTEEICPSGGSNSPAV
jgi:hypothetical protein